MSKNFPDDAIEWVNDTRWTMEIVPLHDVDFDNEGSWAAHHQPARVAYFEDKIQSGKRLKPAILVRVPGKHRLRIVDGHHRALAYRNVGKPMPSFVGAVPDGDDRWISTHTQQLNQGADEANKSDQLPVAAGITVLAADTGRILMLQRALEDDDPAAGTWEFPGGCLENGEMAIQGAIREWQEETGCLLPTGQLDGTWTSSDGVYQGFVYVIEFEDDVDLTDRDDVINPDDPDGDHFEALAWWDPAHLADCPALRSELRRDLDALLSLLADAGE